MLPNRLTKQPSRGWMLLLASVVVTAAGCGSGDRKLYHVSGAVTFDGQSVPGGFVLFEPDFSAKNDGTQGFAEIKDGKYNTASTGKGVTGGAYIMRVRGFVPPDGNVPGKMLFREYEQTIELPTSNTRQEIAVPASAGGDFGPLPEPT